jgi:hypothetical protein
MARLAQGFISPTWDVRQTVVSRRSARGGWAEGGGQTRYGRRARIHHHPSRFSPPACCLAA